jgi:DNA-binding transcriptional LysR family regulator
VPLTDLNLIRAFVAIYETGSVSGAARRMNITQPSVSHSLGRLRDLLDDPLFTRKRDGMTPTFNATQLFHKFRAALDDIDAAIAATRRFDPMQSTRCFRLALSDLGELHLLPFLFREFQKIAPSIALEIVQLDSEKISEWLTTGNVDAAIGNLQHVGGHARKRTLFTETYSCLLSTSHSSIGESLSIDEYVATIHAVVAPFTGHHLVEDVMTEMGIERKIGLRVPHFTNLVEVIASTDLVLTLPTRVARAFVSDGRTRALPVPFPIPSFDVSLYWQPHTEDAAAQHWLCDTISRTLGEL